MRLLPCLARTCAKGDEGKGEPFAHDPAGTLEMRTPASLGVTVAYVYLQNCPRSLLPSAAGIGGFEQGCIERQVTAVIIVHYTTGRRSSFDCRRVRALMLSRMVHRSFHGASITNRNYRS